MRQPLRMFAYTMAQAPRKLTDGVPGACSWQAEKAQGSARAPSADSAATEA